MKYSKLAAKYFVSFVFYSLLACQAADYSNAVQTTFNSPPPVSEKPVFDNVAEGAVNGHAWQMASGKASLFTRNKKVYLEIKLWEQPYTNPCEQSYGSTFQVRLYAANQVGMDNVDPSDPFTSAPTIIFSDLTESASSRNNMVANKGMILIASMQNGRVTGSVQGSFSTGAAHHTEVTGNFDVPFCSPASY